MRASGPLAQAIRAIGPSEESDMDLATRYLGLALRNPIIASASPLTGEVGTIRQLEDWGAGAVVLPSLFEEQIRQEEQLAEMLTSVGADSSPEASSYFPASTKYNAGPHGYLDLVARARAAVDIPVIASLNGTTEAGWVDYARLVEQAGAAALELNIYRIEVRPGMTGAEVDADCMRLFTAVRSRVAIPVSVKLHPCYSAFGALALQLDAAGAGGLVLFNRVYQSDIDQTTCGGAIMSRSAAPARSSLVCSGFRCLPGACNVRRSRRAPVWRPLTKLSNTCSRAPMR
jgi:dihydroorotate dehydrogenase (fumarate)